MADVRPDEVVWAKLKGYPWWPAVVPSKQVDRFTLGGAGERLISVNFVGDSMQYQLSSASIRPTQIVRFAEGFETYAHSEKKVSTNQRLQACIKCAQELDKGERSIADLPKLNKLLARSRFRKSPKPYKCKRTSSSSQPLSSPARTAQIPASPANRVSPASDILPQFLLSQHLSKLTLEPWLQGLYSTEEINPHLKRLLKPLASELMEQKETRHLGLLCQRVRLKATIRETELALRTAIGMKKEEHREPQCPRPIKIEENDQPKDLIKRESREPSEDASVADLDLQKKVCRAIFQILSQNGFDAESGKSLALRIERRLRSKDPSMCDSYRSLYKRMIKDIRMLTPEGVSGAPPSVKHSAD